MLRFQLLELSLVSGVQPRSLLLTELGASAKIVSSGDVTSGSQQRPFVEGFALSTSMVNILVDILGTFKFFE